MKTKAEIDADIAEIKAHMPHVYQGIQAKAAEIGNGAFAMVRRGLAGEPNCWYAFERGRVKGTPVVVPNIMADVAQAMVQFGCAHVCIWGPGPQGGANGTH